MMPNELLVATRELSIAELFDVSGGAINAQFTLFGRTWFYSSGDGWQSICVADEETYNCVTNVGDRTYTSSGPVPR